MKHLLLVSILFFVACVDIPTEPEPEPTPTPEADFIIDGSLSASYTSYDCPKLSGNVRNTGNATGYNVKVAFTAYKNNVIMDTANGFPANLGNIPVGTCAAFEAVFFDLSNHNQYDRYTTEITFLTK